MNSLGDKIKARRMELEMDQSELAKQAGVSQPTLANLESGKNQRSKYLPEIAKVLGLSLDELVTGAPVSALLPANYKKVVEHDPDNQDYIPIKTVRLKLSAGISGFAVEPERGEGMPIVFQREWLERNGYFAENLIAVKIRGESMRPKLDDGDLVVINTADKIPKDNQLYAVNFDGEDVIKRLRRENKEWWLVSDNPDQRSYPKQICRGGSCIIIGQIIHMQSRTF